MSPKHPGYVHSLVTVKLHKRRDNLWRIQFQRRFRFLSGSVLVHCRSRKQQFLKKHIPPMSEHADGSILNIVGVVKTGV
jgi:hypothetical protein